MSRVTIISADCHAGALPATYEAYMPERYHEYARAWWLSFARQMLARTGTFFDQEAIDAFSEATGEAGLFGRRPGEAARLGDEDFLRMLSDGEYDADVRVKDLDADGVAGEVIFPQMAPFGGGLMQYRDKISPEHNLEQFCLALSPVHGEVHEW